MLNSTLGADNGDIPCKSQCPLDTNLYIGTIGQSVELPFLGGYIFEDAWLQIVNKMKLLKQTDVIGYLTEFCGNDALPKCDFSVINGINHIAFYLGDYDTNEQVLLWYSFLQNKAKCGEEITSVLMGPSYISPKQYGTQGWWYSLVFKDGFVIELFCCHRFGQWRDKSPKERVDLMSHLAFEVTEMEAVKPLIEGLERIENHLQVIAYTEQDEMGHTYGHVRNNQSNRVIELVHQLSIEGGGQGETV